jgi:hypothetical protein
LLLKEASLNNRDEFPPTYPDVLAMYFVTFFDA